LKEKPTKKIITYLKKGYDIFNHKDFFFSRDFKKWKEKMKNHV